MDRAILVLCALLLNAALGGPAQWHEATGLGRLLRRPSGLVRDLERRLNREHRSPRDRELRGTVLVVAMVLGCIAGGAILGTLFRHALWFIEPVLLALALPVRPTW